MKVCKTTKAKQMIKKPKASELWGNFSGQQEYIRDNIIIKDSINPTKDKKKKSSKFKSEKCNSKAMNNPLCNDTLLHNNKNITKQGLVDSIKAYNVAKNKFIKRTKLKGEDLDELLKLLVLKTDATAKYFEYYKQEGEFNEKDNR